MATEARLRPATPADVLEIAESMTPECAAECAAVGWTPQEALERGLATSAFAMAIRLDGRPAAVFGVGYLDGDADAAAAWMLAGARLARYPRAAWVLSQQACHQLVGMFGGLQAWVLADAAVSKRWLVRLGWTLAPAAPWGPLGALHHHAVLTR